MADPRYILNDPFSLLSEEEKDKLAQDVLGEPQAEFVSLTPSLNEEQSFIEEFEQDEAIKTNLNVPTVPISTVPFSRQISQIGISLGKALASTVKNIPNNFNSYLLDQAYANEEAQFTLQTGQREMEIPSTISFGEGAASRLFLQQERDLAKRAREDQEAKFNALPQEKKNKIIGNYVNFIQDNYEAWDALQGKIEANRTGLTKTERAISSGFDSLALMTPAILATTATKNPAFMTAMLPVFGHYEYASSYRQARVSGLSHEEAVKVSRINALSEIGTEMIPLPFVTKTLNRYWKDNGSTVQQFVRDGFGTTLREVGGENINTVIQEVNNAYNGVKTELAFAWANKDNPNYKGPSWIDVMLDNAFVTSVASLVGAGGMVTMQGTAAFAPDVVTDIQNYLDPAPAKVLVRELNKINKRIEADFKAIDDTYSYVYASKFLDPERFSVIRAQEEEVVPLEEKTPEDFLAQNRQYFNFVEPQVLPDEFLASRIIANDLVVEELSPAEQELAQEFAAEFESLEQIDLQEVLLNSKKAINILGVQESIDPENFDGQVQERIVEINNQLEAEKNRKTPNKEKITKLEADKTTLQNYIDSKKPSQPERTLERKTYDTDYQGEQYQDDNITFGMHLPTIEDIQSSPESIEDQIKQESDPRDIERVQNEILRPLEFNKENFKFAYFWGTRDNDFTEVLPEQDPNARPLERDLSGSAFTADIRDFTEAESIIAAEVIDNLIKQGMPKEVFKLVSFLGVSGVSKGDKSPYVGQYRTSSQSVLLNPVNFFNLDIYKENIDPELDVNNPTQNALDFITASKADLQQTLAHEMAHAIDFISNQESFAASSPLFASIDIDFEFSKIAEDNGLDPELTMPGVMRRLDIDKVLMHKFTTGGQIFRELFNLYLVTRTGLNKSPLGGKLLSYPFDRYLADINQGNTEIYDQDAESFVKSELFAQAYGLYYTNRRTLGKYAPRTLKLIEDINNATTDYKLATLGLRLRDTFQSDRSDADSQIYTRRTAGRDPREIFKPESTYRRVERAAERPEFSVPVPEQDIAESNYVPIGQLKLTETTQTFAGSPKNEDGSFRNTQKDFNKLAKDLVKLAENPLSLLEQSRDWYKNVNVEIDNLTRGNPKLKEDVLRMLTIYSSQTPVETNLAYTLRSLVSLAKNGDPLPGFQPEAGEYAAAALAAQDFGQKLPGVGFKLQSFYENLTGKNPNAVTMDTWMFRLLGFQENQNALANHRYGTAVIQEATNLYNKKHNDNLTPMEMQAVLWTYARNKDLQAKGKPAEYVGYETFIDKASATVTTEVIPTQTLPEFQFAEQLEPDVKAQMTRDLLDVITTSEGKNEIMEILPGTGLYKFSHSFGAYDGKINPNIISSLILEKVQGEQQFSDLDLSFADDFLKAWGFVFRQEAMPYFVANENISDEQINDLSNESVNSGTEIAFVDSVSGAPIDISGLLREQLKAALEKQGINGFTQLTANEIGIINFKFNGQVIDNFNEKVELAMQEVGLEGGRADINHNIRYTTNYLTNNWEENANGSEYLTGRLEAESLQKRLIRIRSKVDGVIEKYRNGEYERSPNGAFPTSRKDRILGREAEPKLSQEEEQAIQESLEGFEPPAPPAPPPPDGPDPDGDFSLREMSFFQRHIEDFNIKVANKFGRLWTVEENLIAQFGERAILKRLEDLGVDPNSRDWKVTTQTDIWSGRVKDLLRDIREDYFEPLVEFLQSKGIKEAEYNHFIYNLHAPERNAYLPTKFTEDLNKAELELAALEKSRLSTKQELANARRKVTTLKNKIKKAEKGSGVETSDAIGVLKKYGVIFDMKTMTARGSLTKGKNLLEAYEKYHKPLLDFTRKIFVDGGLIPEDKVADWDARYKYYVPLQGFAEDTLIDPKTGREVKRKQSRSNLINSQMTVAGSLVREAKGRESLASGPLQQSIVQATSAAIQTEKNRVIRSLADIARAFPSDLWNVSEDVGDLVVDSKWDETKGYSRVGFREEGVQKYVEIYDRRLAKGFDNFDTAVTDPYMKLLRGATRYLSMVNTSLDPTFMINNFIRDVQSGYFNLLAEEEIEGGRAQGLEIAKKYYTTKNILGNAIDLMRFEKNRNLKPGIVSKKIDENKNELLKQFKKYGGETGYIEQRNIDRLTQDIEDLMSMYQGTFKGNVKKGTESIFKVIETMNMGIENAARFTSFQGYVEMNGGIEQATPAIYERAATLAKNLTINFNRMGTMGPTVNAAYMFFNASIQGTVNTLRGINPADPNFYASRKGKAIMGLIGIGVTQTLFNVLTSDEDEDGRLFYEKLTDWEKQTKFIVMFPGFTFNNGEVIVEKWGAGSKYFVKEEGGKKIPVGLGIPMPYGYAMFHNTGRIITEYMLGKTLDNYDKSFAKSALDLTEALLHNYAPLSVATGGKDPGDFIETVGITATPTALKPITELIANRDHFGTPIYYDPIFTDTSPASYRENKRVLTFIKETAKAVNDATGGNEYYQGWGDFDPAIFQYFLDYATGGLGRTTKRTWQLVFSPDRPKQNQIPVLRRVTVTPNDRMDVEFFRENLLKVTKIENAYRDLDLATDPSEDAEDFLDRINFPLADIGNDLNEYSTRKIGNNSLKNWAENELKALREEKKEVRDEYFESDKKRYYEELDRISNEELEIMKEFNKVYLEAVKAGR